MENERKIPVLTLIRNKHLLDHLASFSEPVEFANFTVSILAGMKTGKNYIAGRTPEMAKTTLRGVNVLNTYYVRREDAVVLTKDQYEDMIALIGPSRL